MTGTMASRRPEAGDSAGWWYILPENQAPGTEAGPSLDRLEVRRTGHEAARLLAAAWLFSEQPLEQPPSVKGNPLFERENYTKGV
jgi:hypothetical protein